MYPRMPLPYGGSTSEPRGKREQHSHYSSSSSSSSSSGSRVAALVESCMLEILNFLRERPRCSLDEQINVGVLETRQNYILL